MLTPEREIPVLYKRKEECCGCTACYAICPKEAISMVEDEEGFEYPQIDESKCVSCYQCIKVCPFKVKKTSSDWFYNYTKHHLKFGKNQSDNLVAVFNRFILDFGADFFLYFIGV